MPDGFQALAASVIALLPGGLFTWGFERQAGNWGIGFSDRVLRFLGTSAFIHVGLAPLTFYVWARYVSSDAVEWTHLPWTLWAYGLGYVFGPFILGTRVGRATRNGRSWPIWFTGPDPAPRAWDYFFSRNPDGWMKLRLKSGVWIGGAFAPAGGLQSYASGYPEPQDIFLARLAEVDRDSGEFILDDGAPVLRASSLLIRWEEVEYLEFADA